MNFSASGRPTLSLKETADFLGIGTRTLFRWRREDSTFPRPLKVQRSGVSRPRPYWFREDLERWLRERSSYAAV